MSRKHSDNHPSKLLSNRPTPWYHLPDNSENPAVQVLVLGAGLAGIATANHLAESGVQVTLIDRETTAASASSGNIAGLIKPQVNSQNDSINNYFKIYYQYFESYIENILKEFPDLPYDFNGIDFPQQSKQRHAASRCGWISPKAFCLAQLKRSRGINTLFGQDVSRIEYRDKQWLCFDKQNQAIAQAPVCILASGYAMDFRQLEGIEISPLSGQVSYLKPSAVTPPIERVQSGKHYCIPIDETKLLIGATHHRHNNAEVTLEDHQQNLRGIRELLANHHVNEQGIIGGRSCVRAVTPDRLPIVGAMPDWTYYRENYEAIHHGRDPRTFPCATYQPGLYIVSGLGAHGIASSPYLGKLLRDLIMEKIPAQSAAEKHLTLLHPGRFLIRKLKRKPSDR